MMVIGERHTVFKLARFRPAGDGGLEFAAGSVHGTAPVVITGREVERFCQADQSLQLFPVIMEEATFGQISARAVQTDHVIPRFNFRCGGNFADFAQEIATIDWPRDGQRVRLIDARRDEVVGEVDDIRSRHDANVVTRGNLGQVFGMRPRSHGRIRLCWLRQIYVRVLRNLVGHIRLGNPDGVLVRNAGEDGGSVNPHGLSSNGRATVSNQTASIKQTMCQLENYNISMPWVAVNLVVEGPDRRWIPLRQ